MVYFVDDVVDLSSTHAPHRKQTAYLHHYTYSYIVVIRSDRYVQELEVRWGEGSLRSRGKQRMRLWFIDIWLGTLCDLAVRASQCDVGVPELLCPLLGILDGRDHWR